jgi:hypothetical protein
MPIFTLPDGRQYFAPENPTNEQRLKVFAELAEMFPEEYGELLDEYRTVGGRIAEAAKAIPRGLIGSFAGSLQGIAGLLTPGFESEAERDLAAFQSRLNEESILAPDSAYRDLYSTKIGEGLGSVASYLVPGAAAKLLGASPTGTAAKVGALSLAGSGGAGEQAQRIQFQRDIGEQVSTGEEIGALLAGTGIGLTEMIPVNRLLKKAGKFDPVQGSALLNILARVNKRGEVAGKISDDITRLLKGSATQGVYEGLQEAIAGSLQDAASMIYDEDVDIGESFLEDLLVGGGVGAIADPLIEALGGRRTVSNKIYRDRERYLREKAIEKYNTEQADEIARRNLEALSDRRQGLLFLPPPGGLAAEGIEGEEPIKTIPTLDVNEGIYTLSFGDSPNRFTRVTVFNSPTESGTQISTIAYNPGTNQYYDLTEDLASGRSVKDALMFSMAGDLGVISKQVDPSATALGFSALQKQISVEKSSNIPTFNPAQIQNDIDTNNVIPLSEESVLNVVPLPSGGYTIVDINSGLPVADFSENGQGFVFKETREDQRKEGVGAVYDAYKKIKELNSKKTAISASNVLNYTGLINSLPSLKLSIEMSSPDAKVFTKADIAGMFDRKKGEEIPALLKEKYSPEEARKILGAKKFDELLTERSQSLDTSNLKYSVENGKLVSTDPMLNIIPNWADIANNPSKRSISFNKLRQIAKLKNLDVKIDDQNFKDFAKYWVGTENWLDMSNGQRLFLISRIGSFGGMPAMTTFPNLLPRQYNRSQFDAVIAEIGAAVEGKTPSISVEDIQLITGSNRAAASQIYNDLIYSGRVSKDSKGKIQLIKSERDYRAERIARDEQSFGADQVTAAGLTSNEVNEASQRLREEGVSENIVQSTQDQAKKPETTVEVSEDVSPEVDRIASQAEENVALGASPDKEAIVAKFQAAMLDYLNKVGLAKLVNVRAENKKVIRESGVNGVALEEAAYFDPISKEIVLNVGNVINDPNLTDQDIVDIVNDRMGNEIISVMREADLITESEWNILSNFVRKVKLDRAVIKDDPAVAIPAMSLIDNVRARYNKPGKPPMNEEKILEEAVAEAYRLWTKHRGKFAVGKPQSIFKKMLDYVMGFVSSFRKSGAKDFNDIFSDIESGRVGARTPGLSIFNPDSNAAIRSLRESDLDAAEKKKIEKLRQQRLKKLPTVSGVKTFEIKPLADLSEKDEERVDEFINNEVLNTPKGFIPRFNPNAPKQAINAALKYEVDGKEPSEGRFSRMYMISTLTNEEIPNDTISEAVKKHGRIKPEDMGFYEKTIHVLENFGLDDYLSAFGNFARDFKRNFVDRASEARRQEGKIAEIYGPEAVQLRAETSASSTLGMLDRGRGILASMLENGGIKWISKKEMATPDAMLFEDDELSGYHEIDTSIPGLLEIMQPLVDGTVPNGMGMFKTFSIYRRIQGFRTRAKEAKAALESLPKDASELTRKSLKAIIEAEKKATIKFNPTDEQISKTLSEIEANYPAVEDAFNKYQKWNGSLVDFAIKTGQISEEIGEMWKAYADYFPFYKDLEDYVFSGTGYRKGSPLTNVDFLFKELSEKANDLEGTDPLEMITKNAMGILTAGLKNVTSGRILRNSVMLGEARLIEDQSSRHIRAMRNEGRFVQSVLHKGTEVFYEIADPLLYESMMNYAEPVYGTLTKILAAPSNVLREMVTREPGFIVINMLRDSFSAWVTSPVGFTPIIDSFKEWNSEEMQELLRQGIFGGYDLVSDPKGLKEYTKKIYRERGVDIKSHSQTSSNMLYRLWDTLGGLSQKSDAAVRTAVYKAVLEETGSVATARLAAIDVINFSRRGANPVWRTVTAAIPFLNARVQGLDKLYTTLTGKYTPFEGLEPRAVAQKRALMRGAMITAMTTVYFIVMQDNEEYQKARREVRDDNWLIPVPGTEGIMLKLPIPFEVGAIFKAIPESTLNLMFGDMDARGWRESIVRQVNNTTNIDLLGFQIIKPFVDVMRNRNSFTGSEIVPYWVNKNKEAGLQFDNRTTELAKDIGQALNISPMKLEYLVNGYGGSIGLTILMTANKAWQLANGDKTAGTRGDWTDPNNIPVVRRFFLDMGTAGTRMQQEFYELKEEADKAVSTINAYKDERDLSGMLAYRASKQSILNARQALLSIDNQLRRYRRIRNSIIDSDMPNERKRQLLRELDQQKDLALTGVPVLREKADIPSKLDTAIIDAFIG